MRDNNTTVIVDQRPQVGIGLFGLLLLVGLVCAYWWQILLAVAVVGAGVMVYRQVRAARQSEAATAARADQQNQWVMSGDPRGVFGEGDEGLRLWGSTAI